MIVLKYAKRFPLSMVSHVDMLNVVKRIFTRADIKVAYSSGFNPHMLLFFSPALSLGIESECEYVCAAADYFRGIKEALNAKAPEGFECVEVFPVDGDPNLSAMSFAARYLFKAAGLGKTDLSKIAGNEGFFVTFKDKDGDKTKSAGGRIYSLEPKSDGLAEAVLACGNDNLRADRVLYQLCADFGLDKESSKIVKTELILKGGLSADDFLNGIAPKNKI